MREIKFRAWDIEGRMYLEWDSVEQFPLEDIVGNEGFILEQFTGIHDSKGQDIYEGDILKTDEAGWIAKVIWSYDGFMLTGLDNTGFSCSPNYAGCEIIGNIHEEAKA